ncbi:YDG domain-containing protein, partial [Rhizobium sp. WW_1]
MTPQTNRRTFSNGVLSHRTRTHKVRLVALLASTALAHATVAPAQSLPSGGQVAAGSATIGTPSAGALTINQTSGSAVVNWQSFNVGKANRVTFVQPDANAAILNRVTGETSSTISGQITANGQVYLINPNGIAITSSGTVKAGAFVASTLGISDDDFMSAKRSFTGNGASAPVTNAGAITINRGGYMALIGGTVANAGVITVPMGKAALGSGEQATLDLSGDGFLQVAVPTKAGGSRALVDNSGKISARGGAVQLTAAAAKDMARQAVNMSGTIEANGVSGKSGDITLTGGDGEVAVSGTLDAGNAAGKGGKVTVTGRSIKLASAKVNASGKTGGGTVNIGGNRQGKGLLQHAETLDVDAHTVINANAVTTGSGGNVVLWSDDLTNFAGTITAKGGALSGNGGEVEVSGKARLSYAGLTDLTAAHGSFGNLLLDPYNVTISTATDSNSSGFTASGNGSIINVNTLTNALATANVMVTTGSSSDAANPQAGTITVAAPIAWTSGSTLTLNAASDININAPVTLGAGGLALSSGGIVHFAAPVTVKGAGTVDIEASDYDFGLANSGFTGSLTYVNADGTAATSDQGGVLKINGQAYTLLYSMSDLDGTNGALNLAGNYALAQNLDATGNSYTTGVIAGGNSDIYVLGVFSGTFEGLGHRVANLTITGSADNMAGGSYYVGLIGDSTGTIRDIGVTGATVGGLSYVGGLVGYQSGGSISNAYATGAVIGNEYAGGLVGENDGSIRNAYATGAVRPSVNIATSSDTFGGLVGYNTGSISNAYATGAVSGVGERGGGLVGQNDGTISIAYATGAVSGFNGYVGGLVGYNNGSISNAYATGAARVTTAHNGDSDVGGLVGYNGGSITNAYATGAAIGNAYVAGVGGLVGDNRGSITNAYATGAVSGSAYFGLGGLAGYSSSGATVTNSYYDINTTGFNTTNQTSDPSGATGLTTAQFQDGSSASRLGGAFTVTSGLYPYLTSFFPNGVQAISGSAYTTVGLTPAGVFNGSRTPASLGLNGAISVTAFANGTSFGSATTGANGYYYIFGAAGSITAGNSLVAYTSANATTGAANSATLMTATSAANQSGLNLFGNALTVATSATTLSSAEAGATLSSARASAITAAGGDATASAAINAITGQGFIATGASFTIDQAVDTANTLFVGTTAAGAPVTVANAITIENGGSVGLVAAGALTVNAPITVKGAGGVGLGFDQNTTTPSVTDLSFGLTPAGFKGGVTFANADGSAATSSQGGTLAINGQAYKLLYNNSDLALFVLMNPDVNYALAGNLDATGFNTGDFVRISQDGFFSGTFEGLGHTVANLTIAGGSDAYEGLIGYSMGTIRDIGFTGGEVSGDSHVGWLVGQNLGTVSNVYATGIANGASYVGGIAGENDGTISNAYATGAVGGNNTVGGIAGQNVGTISNAYATGTVNGGSSIGGIAGYNGGTISNAYATGAVGVVGGLSSIGGLVGYNRGTISNAYATGAVSGSSNVGGLAGQNVGTISHAYWDTSTSGTTTGIGSDGNNQSGNITGLTTAEMLDPFTFITAGWDFASVWGKSTTGANGGYMMLRSLSSGFYDDYVKIGNGSRIYGDANSTIAGATLSGLGTGNVSLAWGSAITGRTNAGTYNYSDPDIVSVTENGSRTAYVDYGGTLTISQRVLNLSGSSTYNGTTNVAAPGLSLSNLANGETLTLIGGGSMADKNVGTGKVLSLGTLALGNSINGDGGLASNYTLIGGTDTVDIAKATISSISGITAGNKIYDGNANATLNTSGVVFNGMAAGDSLTLGNGVTGAFSDRNAGTGKTVTISGLLLNGTDAGNYTLALDTATTTADITKATISDITGITANNKTYNGNTTAVLNTAGAGFTGIVAGDTLTVATATGTFSDKNAGAGKTVTISGLTLGGADVGNYALASDAATTTADIAKATISDITGITANNKTYNGNTTAVLNTAGAGFTGIVAGDTLTVATATGTFSDKNAGSVKTVNISDLTLGGADNGNYTLASDTATTTADITKAYVFFGGTSVNTKTYDGTTAATVNIYTIPINGDDMQVGYTSANFSDKNAGMSKTVAVDGLYISGADANNYQLGIANTTSYGTITPAIISAITGITAGNKTYDGTTNVALNTAGAVFNGMIAGDSLTVGTALGAFSNANAGTGKTIGISGLTLGGADAQNYRLDTNTATTLADIGQRVVNLSGSRTYNGSTDLEASIFTLSNLAGGETLTLSGTGTMADKNAGSGKGVTLASLALGDGTNGGLASNYTLAGGTDTVDIARAMISSIGGIIANGKIYDGTKDATLNTAGAVFSGMVPGDTLSLGNGFSGAFSDKNAGTGKTVTISGLSLGGADAGNYTLAYNTATTLADIAKRAITVTTDGAHRTYGDANPGFTYTVGGSGLVAGDTLSGALATSATTASGIGNYGITLGTLANSNYDISYTGADLAITPRALTVTADAKSKTYGDANPALTYTTSGLVNNDTLSGSLVTSAGQYSGVGGYGITLGSLGNANYAITYNAANLTVTPRALTVAADAKSKIYGDANPALSYATSGLVNNDTLSGSLSTSAGQYSNVGSYGITLGSLGNANYAITYNAANLTVTPRALTVTADAKSKTYGNANPALTYTTSSLVNGDMLS